MCGLPKFLKSPAVCLWGTISLLALYPLSAGPVWWLICHTRFSERSLGFVYYIYAPVSWLSAKSDFMNSMSKKYLDFWHDKYTLAATPNYGHVRPDEPPMFTELAGTLLGAWLIWNFVRWMNQRKVAAP